MSLHKDQMDSQGSESPEDDERSTNFESKTDVPSSQKRNKDKNQLNKKKKGWDNDHSSDINSETDVPSKKKRTEQQR